MSVMGKLKLRKTIALFLASTGWFFNVSPAYSQNFGNLQSGFDSVKLSGTTGECGTQNRGHQFTISSQMKIKITVQQSDLDDPTFDIVRKSPRPERITRGSDCGEDDEEGSSESATLTLEPGNYEIKVGNYEPRQASYSITIYECRGWDC